MNFRKSLTYISLTIAALTFLYPFYWMIIASLLPESQIGDLTLIPEELTFSNYLTMFSKIPIFRSLLNSSIVAILSTSGIIVFGSIVGYALAKMTFKGRDVIFFIIIFTMTLPFQITLIPNYILMVKFGWVDSFCCPDHTGLEQCFCYHYVQAGFSKYPRRFNFSGKGRWM